MPKQAPEGVSIGKFDILATYTYAKGLLDGLPDDEAKERGLVAALMGARARSGHSPGSPRDDPEGRKKAAEKKGKGTITAASFDRHVADKMGAFFADSFLPGLRALAREGLSYEEVKGRLEVPATWGAKINGRQFVERVGGRPGVTGAAAARPSGARPLAVILRPSDSSRHAPKDAAVKNLQELFIEQLKDVHNAEKQLVRALPKMAKAAKAAKLRKAFQDHLEVTKGQVERLDAIFTEVGARPGRKKCAAMEGLIQEGQELIAAAPPASVLDAGLIAAAQRVEHYEIAAYGTLRSYARLLGHKGAVKQLEKTLKEESDTDQLLNELAEGGVNEGALAPPEAEQADKGEGLIGKTVKAIAEATGLATEAPKPKKTAKGAGRKKSG